MLVSIAVVDLVRRFERAEDLEQDPPPMARWQTVKWKHASREETGRELAPHEAQLWDLEPLAACLTHPEWWEGNERLAEDDDIELIYDDLLDVPEESAVRYRTFSRLGRSGLARCRHAVWYPFLRARR